MQIVGHKFGTKPGHEKWKWKLCTPSCLMRRQRKHHLPAPRHQFDVHWSFWHVQLREHLLECMWSYKRLSQSLCHLARLAQDLRCRHLLSENSPKDHGRTSQRLPLLPSPPSPPVQWWSHPVSPLKMSQSHQKRQRLFGSTSLASQYVDVASAVVAPVAPVGCSLFWISSNVQTTTEGQKFEKSQTLRSQFRCDWEPEKQRRIWQHRMHRVLVHGPWLKQPRRSTNHQKRCEWKRT